MFNNMKNQVREKTGREIPKFTPQKGGLSRQSRQGSESSISSLVVEPLPLPLPNPQAQVPDSTQLKLPDGRVLSSKEVSQLIKKEEEMRAKLEKKDTEWNKKLEKRESELIQEWTEKREEWKQREYTLTEDLLKQTNELKDALHMVDEYKRKICQYQEDKDQLEGFQTQEMAKIKHLLLAKEKENSEMLATLKENTSLLEALKTEVNRLRPYEEEISKLQDDIEMLRHTSEKERWQLCSKLAQSEEQVRHLTDRVAVLTRRSESDAGVNVAPDERIQALLGERALLERRLEEAHVHLADIKASWSAQISSLETQVGRLSRQAGEEGAERRRAEARIGELEVRLEEEVKEREKLSIRAERLAGERDSLAADLKALTAGIESVKSENSELTSRIEASESAVSKAQRDCERLREELVTEKDSKKQLEENVDRLRVEMKTQAENSERALSEEKTLSDKLRGEMEKEKKQKDEALLRNAQVSQEVDIARHELKQQQNETEDLYKKINTLEGSLQERDQEIVKYKSEVAELLGQVSSLQTEAEARQLSSETERNLRETITDLEAQLSDRNKNIRVLQQRLSDMKKTLQRELKASEPSGEAVSNHNTNLPVLPRNHVDEDVNFLYLKHVIIKFLTCREYEAQHLTKAVATVLKLSPDEEGLLKETLDWRMSWFGTRRPKLPNNHLNS